MRRALVRTAAVAACGVAMGACGGDDAGNAHEGGGTPAFEGLYRVTATPASQACGTSIVTFTAESVLVVGPFEDEETGEERTFVIWDGGTLYEAIPASVESAHFSATWISQSSDALPCPATGVPQVVTTLTNLWVGDAGEGGFQSTLFQQIDTDCGTDRKSVV